MTATRAATTVDEGVLRGAAVLFAVAVLVHNLDHLRRGGDSVAADVFVAGSLAVVLEVGVVLLAFARHHLAPLAAVSVGFPLAVGYVVVHFLPARGWLSDALPGGDVGWFSWVAASFEVVAAVALGLAGLAALRVPGPPAGRSLRAAATHPFVVAFAAANLAIVVLSVLDR